MKLVFSEFCQERVLDALCEDMEERGGPKTYRPLHVLGLDVRDNHVEAERGANDTLALIQTLEAFGDDWEDRLDDVLEDFNRRTGKEVTHVILYY